VLAVVAVPEGADEDSTTRLGRELVRLAGTGPLAPLRIGVSGHGSGLASLGRLRDEAVGALHALEGERGSRCAHFHEVEAQVLVRSLAARLPPGTSLSGLDRLAAHDDRYGGGLVATLRSYLAACGSASAAAAALGIHVTTLRHRLGRIAEVSGLRLDDPAVRVACDLLLRHRSP
jgi:sugar diacid utilization regulator